MAVIRTYSLGLLASGAVSSDRAGYGCRNGGGRPNGQHWHTKSGGLGGWG